MVAFGILVVGLLGLGAVVYRAGESKQLAREQVLAYNAARKVLEGMRSERLEEVYARFNAGSSDDPAGPGSAPGAEFEVEGLTPLPGKKVGRISFPEGGVPPGLREDVRDPAFGMPNGRDLNRDGRIDGLPHSYDYKILPVRISLEWRSLKGIGRLDMNALLTQK